MEWVFTVIIVRIYYIRESLKVCLFIYLFMYLFIYLYLDNFMKEIIPNLENFVTLSNVLFHMELVHVAVQTSQ